MASRVAYVVALRHLGPTGAERRAARFALGNMRGVSLESWSWNPRWAVGELLGLVAVRGLGRPPHGTGMRHGRLTNQVPGQKAVCWQVGERKSDVDVVARVRKQREGASAGARPLLPL
jgi:hypothetical protein